MAQEFLSEEGKQLTTDLFLIASKLPEGDLRYLVGVATGLQMGQIGAA